MAFIYLSYHALVTSAVSLATNGIGKWRFVLRVRDDDTEAALMFLSIVYTSSLIACHTIFLFEGELHFTLLTPIKK